MNEKPDRPVEEIIAGLQRYNEWRRGADFEQPNPADIGRDIDDAITIMAQIKEDGEKMTIDTTLEARERRYGNFAEHARITQNIKRAMADSPNWGVLTDDKREALEMLAHKIGRILNGDPGYKDSWHDIRGYTKLVEDTLND